MIGIVPFQLELQHCFLGQYTQDFPHLQSATPTQGQLLSFSTFTHLRTLYPLPSTLYPLQLYH